MQINLQPISLFLCVAICFLSACSRSDEVNPKMLEIKTGTVTYDDGWNFTIHVDQLENLPVTEHGILHLSFSRGSTDRDYVPRIGHAARMKFDKPLVLGANTYRYTGSDFAGKYFYYYRAYAIKSDGSVVYGDVKNYTFPQLQDF